MSALSIYQDWIGQIMGWQVLRPPFTLKDYRDTLYSMIGSLSLVAQTENALDNDREGPTAPSWVSFNTTGRDWQSMQPWATVVSQKLFVIQHAWQQQQHTWLDLLVTATAWIVANTVAKCFIITAVASQDSPFPVFILPPLPPLAEKPWGKWEGVILTRDLFVAFGNDMN